MASGQIPRSRRLLLDTNVVVAALLWNGPPWRLMGQAVEDGIELITSEVLLTELRHTLNYPKFAKRQAMLQTDVDALMSGYEAIVTLVEPAAAPRIVRDPDDDHVIAAAVAGQAEQIVTGDQDLLILGSHAGIAIVTARQALERIAPA
jgi:putative PIN family toxin of toxin-antitoxin system